MKLPIISLLLLFPLAFSTCTNDIFCYICPYDTYDVYYETTLRLLYSQNQVLNTSSCLPKNISSAPQKKVLIMNSPICVECQTFSFDAIYDSLGQAFENETRFSLPFLHSQTIFYLQDGDHYIVKDDFTTTNPQLFRRILLDVKIQSFSGLTVNVYIKTNNFFIFVSKNFIVENVSFFGFDLVLNYDNSCKNFKNQTCCTETKMNQIYNESIDCSVVNAKTTNNGVETDLGMFNIEYIFDNFDTTAHPYLILRNCSFNNFYLLNNTNGFGTIVMMTTFSGTVVMENITVQTSYFMNSFIYYLITNYDLYQIIFGNHIQNSSYLNNTNILQETVDIRNSKFVNYNIHLNFNPEILDNLISLFSWKGSIMIENSSFVGVFNIPCILSFSNDNNQGNVTIANSNFSNIFFIPIMDVSNIISVTLNYVQIANLQANSSEIVMIEGVKIVWFNFIDFLNITCGNSIFPFTFADSNVGINNSFFSQMNVRSIITQINNNLTISNCNFKNSILNDALVIFSFGQNLIITQSYFSNLTSRISIFYVISSSSCIIQTISVKNSSLYSLFFLNNIYQNLVNEILLINNILTLLWSSDQTCKLTSFSQSFLTQNIFSNLFVDFNTPNIILNFDNIYLHFNSFVSTAIIRQYFGVGYFNQLSFIWNFFTNSKIFLMVLNFSKGVTVYLNNSYFENNGITSTKRKQYVGTTDNCFVSMGLGVKLTIYDNLTLIASDKIEMGSGFFSGDTHGGLFQLGNSRLIFLSANPKFDYKGLYMGDFVTAKVFNNSFFNLLCNNLTKLHMHGSIFLGASSSYIYSVNSRSLYFSNNVFVNCSCAYFGGAFATIGMGIVEIQNCSFKNSSANQFAGSLLLIATGMSFLNNTIFDTSVANEGSAAYFVNVMNLTLINTNISKAFSRKNGVIFCRNINSLTIKYLRSTNTSTLQNGGFFFLINGVAKLEHIVIYNSSALLRGGSIHLGGSSALEINDIQIEYSQAATGGSINIENANNITILNCSIIKSMSKVKAAAISVNSIKWFSLRNITIQENINANGNGVIFIETDDESAFMSLKNVTCIDNIALMGSCLYYFSSTPLNLDSITIQNCFDYAIYTSWSYKISLSISNVVIRNIQSKFEIISINNGKVYFNNWELNENKIIQSLFSFTEVNGEISQINVIQNQGLQVFNFFFSDIAIYNIIVYNTPDFSNIIGFCAGISTNLSLGNGTISNSENKEFAIAGFFGGNIFLHEVTFQGSKGQVLDINLGNLFATNCYFQNNTSFSNTKSNDLMFSNTDTFPYNATINNCVFEIIDHYSLDFGGLTNIILINSSFNNLNSNESYKVFAIHAFNIYMLELNSSRFYGFTDSAVQLFNDRLNMEVSKNYAVIFDSIFSLNKARLGSSLYISGTFELYFSNCTFSKNYAYISEKNIVGGMAPAIFFKPLNNIRSKIAILSSEFINNTAEYIAPTVFSQTGVFVDRFNTFYNNIFLSACNFTDKIFAVPASIKPILYENEDGLNLFDSSSNSNIKIVSGQNFNLTLKITDFFGHPLTFDNSTAVLIKGQDIILENNLMIAKNGIISFQNVIVKTHSNVSFTLSFEANLQKFNKDSASELNSVSVKSVYNFTTRECLPGEIIRDDLTCSKCKESTYSLIDPMVISPQFQQCFPCPENAHCMGGSYITPLPGFFRKTSISTNVVPCPDPESCLGYLENQNSSDPSLIHGFCAPGSFGPVCFYCDMAFGKYQNQDVCSHCDVIEALLYTRLTLTFLFVLMNIMISVANIEKFSKKDADRDLFSILTKIIINHSQHLMLIMRNSLALPDFSLFKNFFNGFEYFSFLNVGSFMNECFINSFYYNPQKATVYISLYAAFIPFALALSSIVLWVAIAEMSKKCFKLHTFDHQLKTFRQKFFFKYIVYLLITAYMFYPMILKSSFTLVDCFKLDQNDTTTYLRQSPDIECWNTEHFKYLCFYALPGLLIWGLAFPTFLFVLLRINRKTILKMKRNNLNTGKSKISFVFGGSVNLEEIDKSPQPKKSIFAKLKNEIKNHKYSLTEKRDEILKHQERQPINEKSQEGSLRESKDNFNISKQIEETKREALETLNFDPKKVENKQPPPQTKDHHLTILSYFYCGYRSTYYYWEIVIFVRKFLLTFILTLDQKIKEEYKWSLVVSILFIIFWMTVINNPYKIKFLNKLEMFSLAACLFSCFIAFLSVADENSIFKGIFNIICVGMNFVFYAIAILLILYDFYGKFKGKGMKFKEYLKGAWRKSLKKSNSKKTKSPSKGDTKNLNTVTMNINMERKNRMEHS